MSRADEIRERLEAALEEISAANRHVLVVESSAGRAAGILLEVNGDAGNADLVDAYSRLAEARNTLRDAEDSLHAAWEAVRKAVGR